MTDKANKVTPDEVIGPDGARLQPRRLFADTALLLPNLVKLVSRLLRDPRVPRRAKIALGIASVYAASPVDLIPDFVPVIGWADDVLVVMFAIDSLIERAGPEIVTEHWDGPGDILAVVREVVGVSRSLVPRRLGMMIDRFSR